MNTKIITGAETAPLKVSSLPSRPTAPTSFGGKGYSAREMKEAFDRLPLFIIERLNSLILDISSGEVLSGIPTGIGEGKTLKDILSGLGSGELAGYLTVLGKSLVETILEINEKLSESEHGDTELGEALRILENELAAVLDAQTALDVRLTERTDNHESRLAAVEEDCMAAGAAVTTHEGRITDIEDELAVLLEDTKSAKEFIGEASPIIEDIKGEALTTRIYTPEESDDLYYSVELNSKDEYRLSYINELDVYLPIWDDIAEDFFAIISFDTGEDIPTISIYSDYWVMMSGDGVNYDSFYPQVGYHYTLVFWFDGNMQCAIRRTSNE